MTATTMSQAAARAHVPGAVAPRSISELEPLAAGRYSSLIAPDVMANEERIRDAVRGRRLLVVGGAGSIGSATIRVLLTYHPAAIHVVDHNENALAELIRDLRSAAAIPVGVEIRLWPIDFGGPIARRLIGEEPPYDIVLNFAALKHVRSEKDVYSLLQMLETNVVKQARFASWLARRGGVDRYFGVSTDKAANPASLMGASKRLMEDVLFSTPYGITVTSARFANVAFSNGSLLQAWLRRLELGQPLAVPRDTRRYFVTHREAAEICLIATTLAGHSSIVIPRLHPAEHLVLLEDVAVRVLEAHGLQPVYFENEGEAQRALPGLTSTGRWPLLLTPLDTSGEKSFEEFVGTNEVAQELGLAAVLAVTHPVAIVAPTVSALEAIIEHHEDASTKQELVEIIADVTTGFHHVEGGRSLDERL